MNPLRVFLFGALCAVSMMASAQWQWIDKDGRKVYSDRSPPSDIPEKNVLKQPGGKRSLPAETAAAAPAASAPAAGVPKLSGKDAGLEAKKKKADDDEAAKRKADDEKLAKAQSENCVRARRNMEALKSGARIQQFNTQGEREFMSDEARAAESSRVQGIIDSDCK
ncbi:DUF4124 domain-containing protein [Variovorax terrae]|uniref:DUF4124 domain-containing protein n=1 Tax=Variovorax terrae TaxID=2923278 RepID=A0A9X1VSS1_9BURK|nr:DUF4124 domain-containing protein [Variovorax terrae]MCJ0763216.1 DUF4124 domain-containing protein [Variovorax terrae]